MFSASDFEIIDAHIHPFLDLKDCIGRYGQPKSTNEFFAELRRMGVRYACGSVIIKQEKPDFEIVQKANRAALKLRDLYPDFYVPGIHIDGNFPKESIQELAFMHQQGVCWIGELVPYIMHTGDYASEGMMEIYAVAREYNMVVNIHDGDPLENIDRITQKYPGLKIVLAHPGENARAEVRFNFVAKHPDVYMDISGTGLFRWGMLRHALDICGADKIIFGSDFPVGSCGMNIYGALAEHLSKEEFRQLFSLNFRALTKMTQLS